jgi:acyl-CoA thioester hydrolase|tara:strand:- start:79 stop:474 length:396 start_codon:yes stop_codon:yes gene_type:complete
MSKVYQHKIKIYYEDTDAGGVVYYANYLKYMERARSEMICELLDLSLKDLKINYDIIFLVRSCNIKYLKSAQFEDYLTITTKMIKKTSVRLNLIQETKRKEELLTSAEVELAVVNNQGKVNKLPLDLLERL